MNGWPVWLASTSLRDRHGNIVSTEGWDEATFDRMSASLDHLLDGVGDTTKEREFRMCITLCRHRALTVEERDALPEWWFTSPARDLAGGPIEVRWHRGIPETLSTQPCRNPEKQYLSGRGGPGLYLPIDCGKCDTCQARNTCHNALPG